MVFNLFGNNEQDELYDRYLKKFEDNDRKIKELNKLIKGQHAMLNNIFVFYNLEPTPFLASMHEVGYEMLKFMGNVCNKHGLDWWADYGTLIGAVRHADYIPWDDDLDCGMMRRDYNVLMDVIHDEIAENNLEYITAEYKLDKHTPLKTKRWFQIKFMHPDLEGSICTIDVFPYDYIRDYNGEDIEKTYYECMDEYYRHDRNEDMQPYINMAFEKLNLTLEDDTHIISGIESIRGKIRMYPYQILKREEIFPLNSMKFGECTLPVPNKTKDYLKYIYGKGYMKIPNKIRNHDRLDRYVNDEMATEVIQNEIDILKRANGSYE